MTLKICCTVLFFGFAFSNSSNAQKNLHQKTDSLELVGESSESEKSRFYAYRKLVDLWFRTDTDRSKSYNRKAIDIATEAKNDTLRAIGHARYSIFMTVDGKIDSAKYHSQIAYELARTLGDTMAMAKTEHALGWYYAYTGNYLLAIEYYDKSLANSIRLNDQAGIRNTKVKIALLYSNMKEYKKSARILEELANEYPKNTLIIYNLGGVYSSLKDRENAIKYYTLFLEKTANRPENYKKLQAKVAIARLNNNATVEEIYHKEVLSKVDSMGEKMMKISRSLNYANFLNRQERYHEAISIISNVTKNKNHTIKPTALLFQYDILSEAYKGIGNYEEALKYKELHSEQKEEYQRLNNLDRIIDREKNLEFQNKNITIAQLKSDQKLKTKQISRLSLSLMAILGLLSLSIFLFLKNRSTSTKLKEQNKQLDQTIGEKITLLQETHHRVKNNLQIISSLLNLQRKYTPDKKTTDILINSRNRVKSMALIHQMLYQGKVTVGINVRDYTETLTNSLLSSFSDTSENISIINNVENILLHEDTINPIGLIINELVTNSIKYAFPENEEGAITIELSMKGDHLALNVSDNGIGIDHESLEGSSFGHSLLHSLSKKLNADIDITNNNGTHIKLKIYNFIVIENSSDSL